MHTVNIFFNKMKNELILVTNLEDISQEITVVLCIAANCSRTK